MRQAFGCVVLGTMLVLCNWSLPAQNPPAKTPRDLPLTRTLSKIPPGCTDIEVDQQGNIYLIQPGKHKLIKMFRETGFDSVQVIGGKGTHDEGFDTPSQIDVPNRQRLYLLDQMNRRILLFNTNLKVTRELNFLETGQEVTGQGQVDMWPAAFVAGPTGELYLLNENDNKIYKTEENGTFQLSFGGLDYGVGSLEEPHQLCINNQNFLFVSDTTRQIVKVFDFYGIFQYDLYPQGSFRWHGISTLDNYLICYGKQHLMLLNLFTREIFEFPAKGKTPILDVETSRDFLYILRENEITFHSYTR